MEITEFLRTLLAFEREAHSILASYETSQSRVFTVDESYRRLGQLTLHQDNLLRQALRSTEFGLYRSAIVMAWAALIDVLENKIAEDGFKALNKAYPKWKIRSIADLRDRGSDFQLVGAARKVRLCSQTEEKAVKGMLSLRNESAHPSDFEPDLNVALGFVSGVLQRIQTFRGRSVA